MAHRALVLALAVLAGACTVRRVQGPNTVPRPAPGPGGQAGVDGEAPLAALNRVDAWLVGQGASRLGPAQRNPNLPQNRVIAYAIDAEPGRCYTAVAFASPPNDLDLVLLGPSGEQVAHDVRNDAHPWVSFCATERARYVVRVQMARGSGEYLYAVYTAPAGAQPDLAGYWGRGGGAAPAQVEIDPATRARLEALDRQLGAEGFTRSAPPQGLRLAGSQERLFPLQLAPGQCYAFATLAGPGAEDTDAALVDATGREVVQDIRTDADALVRYCPAQPVRYQLRARLYDGAGPVFTAAWVQSRGDAGPQDAPVIGDSTEGVGLEENFRLLDADMRARGYEAFGETERGALTQGSETDFALELEGGKCYAVLAVGDNGVRDLDLQLVDARSQVIDRDIEVDARPVVRVCPERSGAFRMRVRMYRGQGQFVYATYRWPRGTRGPFGLEGLIYVRLAEVTSLLDVEGYQPDLDVEPGQGRLTAAGQARTHRVRLEPGRCYAVLAVGGDGVADLDLRVLRNGTVKAQDDTHTAFPSVRLCADGSGAYDVALEAANGSGAYFYQVFRQG